MSSTDPSPVRNFLRRTAGRSIDKKEKRRRVERSLAKEKRAEAKASFNEQVDRFIGDTRPRCMRYAKSADRRRCSDSDRKRSLEEGRSPDRKKPKKRQERKRGKNSSDGESSASALSSEDVISICSSSASEVRNAIHAENIRHVRKGLNDIYTRNWSQVNGPTRLPIGPIFHAHPAVYARAVASFYGMQTNSGSIPEVLQMNNPILKHANNGILRGTRGRRSTKGESAPESNSLFGPPGAQPLRSLIDQQPFTYPISMHRSASPYNKVESRKFLPIDGAASCKSSYSRVGSSSKSPDPATNVGNGEAAYGNSGQLNPPPMLMNWLGMHRSERNPMFPTGRSVFASIGGTNPDGIGSVGTRLNNPDANNNTNSNTFSSSTAESSNFTDAEDSNGNTIAIPVRLDRSLCQLGRNLRKAKKHLPGAVRQHLQAIEKATSDTMKETLMTYHAQAERKIRKKEREIKRCETVLKEQEQKAKRVEEELRTELSTKRDKVVELEKKVATQQDKSAALRESLQELDVHVNNMKSSEQKALTDLRTKQQEVDLLCIENQNLETSYQKTAVLHDESEGKFEYLRGKMSNLLKEYLAVLRYTHANQIKLPNDKDRDGIHTLTIDRELEEWLLTNADKSPSTRSDAILSRIKSPNPVQATRQANLANINANLLNSNANNRPEGKRPEDIRPEDVDPLSEEQKRCLEQVRQIEHYLSELHVRVVKNEKAMMARLSPAKGEDVLSTSMASEILTADIQKDFADIDGFVKNHFPFPFKCPGRGAIGPSEVTMQDVHQLSRDILSTLNTKQRDEWFARVDWNQSTSQGTSTKGERAGSSGGIKRVSELLAASENLDRAPNDIAALDRDTNLCVQEGVIMRRGSGPISTILKNSKERLGQLTAEEGESNASQINSNRRHSLPYRANTGDLDDANPTSARSSAVMHSVGAGQSPAVASTIRSLITSPSKYNDDDVANKYKRLRDEKLSSRGSFDHLDAGGDFSGGGDTYGGSVYCGGYGEYTDWDRSDHEVPALGGGLPGHEGLQPLCRDCECFDFFSKVFSKHGTPEDTCEGNTETKGTYRADYHFYQEQERRQQQQLGQEQDSKQSPSSFSAATAKRHPAAVNIRQSLEALNSINASINTSIHQMSNDRLSKLSYLCKFMADAKSSLMLNWLHAAALERAQTEAKSIQHLEYVLHEFQERQLERLSESEREATWDASESRSERRRDDFEAVLHGRLPNIVEESESLLHTQKSFSSKETLPPNNNNKYVADLKSRESGVTTWLANLKSLDSLRNDPAAKRAIGFVEQELERLMNSILENESRLRDRNEELERKIDTNGFLQGLQDLSNKSRSAQGREDSLESSKVAVESSKVAVQCYTQQAEALREQAIALSERTQRLFDDDKASTAVMSASGLQCSPSHVRRPSLSKLQNAVENTIVSEELVNSNWNALAPEERVAVAAAKMEFNTEFTNLRQQIEIIMRASSEWQQRCVDLETQMKNLRIGNLMVQEHERNNIPIESLVDSCNDEELAEIREENDEIFMGTEASSMARSEVAISNKSRSISPSGIRYAGSVKRPISEAEDAQRNKIIGDLQILRHQLFGLCRETREMADQHAQQASMTEADKPVKPHGTSSHIAKLNFPDLFTEANIDSSPSRLLHKDKDNSTIAKSPGGLSRPNSPTHISLRASGRNQGETGRAPQGSKSPSSDIRKPQHQPTMVDEIEHHLAVIKGAHRLIARKHEAEKASLAKAIQQKFGAEKESIEDAVHHQKQNLRIKLNNTCEELKNTVREKLELQHLLEAEKHANWQLKNTMVGASVSSSLKSDAQNHAQNRSNSPEAAGNSGSGSIVGTSYQMTGVTGPASVLDRNLDLELLNRRMDEKVSKMQTQYQSRIVNLEELVDSAIVESEHKANPLRFYVDNHTTATDLKLVQQLRSHESAIVALESAVRAKDETIGKLSAENTRLKEQLTENPRLKEQNTRLEEEAKQYKQELEQMVAAIGVESGISVGGIAPNNGMVTNMLQGNSSDENMPYSVFTSPGALAIHDDVLKNEHGTLIQKFTDHRLFTAEDAAHIEKLTNTKIFIERQMERCDIETLLLSEKQSSSSGTNPVPILARVLCQNRDFLAPETIAECFRGADGHLLFGRNGQMHPDEAQHLGEKICRAVLSFSSQLDTQISRSIDNPTKSPSPMASMPPAMRRFFDSRMLSDALLKVLFHKNMRRSQLDRVVETGLGMILLRFFRKLASIDTQILELYRTQLLKISGLYEETETNLTLAEVKIAEAQMMQDKFTKMQEEHPFAGKHLAHLAIPKHVKNQLSTGSRASQDSNRGSNRGDRSKSAGSSPFSKTPMSRSPGSKTPMSRSPGSKTLLPRSPAGSKTQVARSPAGSKARFPIVTRSPAGSKTRDKKPSTMASPSQFDETLRVDMTLVRELTTHTKALEDRFENLQAKNRYLRNVLKEKNQTIKKLSDLARELLHPESNAIEALPLDKIKTKNETVNRLINDVGATGSGAQNALSEIDHHIEQHLQRKSLKRGDTNKEYLASGGNKSTSKVPLKPKVKAFK